MTVRVDGRARGSVAHPADVVLGVWRLLAGVAISVVLLGGCGSDDVPSAVSDRRELPTCGLALEGMGAPPTSNTVRALDCFKNAYLVGDEAELRLRTSGIEGGAQRAWVRSMGCGRVEVFREPDTVFPEYGGYPTDDPLFDDWVRYDCPNLAFSADGFPLFNSEVCDREALPSK